MKYLRFILLAFSAVLMLGCGGSKGDVGTLPVGDKHGSVADDLDVPDDANKRRMHANGAGEHDDKTSGDTDKSSGESPSENADAPPVTFRLKNSANDELVFSLDKGWQPVIFAFSGKPPNAKGILMFSKFCTASCSVSDDERCPTCKAPEKVKDIKAAEKRAIVEPGKWLDVPWDGQIHTYEKVNVAGAKCECFKKTAVPAESYTVRACGLRLTKSAKKSTKYQCVNGSMTFPFEGPQVVELEFPKP